MPKLLQETGRISEAAAAEAKSTGRMLIQHISPGWGSSGYYSSECLEQAVADEIIPAGTHMYADHPTEEEARTRPVRSIKDLMSVTTEPARLATQEDVERGADLGALVSEVDIVPSYRPLIEHLKDAIGVSIRGDGELVEGTAEGRNGKIVESLAHVKSVDWVTRAGRGGKVLSLVESARANRRAIGHGLSEATVNDTREALQTALRDAYGAAPVDRSVWVYVRDFDDSTVWFEVEGSGASDPGIYGQTYTDSDGVIALTGQRVEVRVRTTYVPATRPDSTTPTTESHKEHLMGIKQIEESELTRLTEAAGRVDALITESATKDARIKELEEADAARGRTTRATAIVEARAKEAGVTFTPREVKGFLADITLTEAGELDEAAFTTLVDEDAAARKADGGAGQVRGHGSSVTEGGSTVTLADIDEALGLEKTGA
ncbi:hypothetical protein [Nocardioides lijunqiniae]|uniref:hypothetical protein n=1 Tax=Nocardioides lijunqiniae TaxID=2760832 RepID=UPI001878EBC2|nr:hypothetical protein [Nocardioides lijunqiniae]